MPVSFITWASKSEVIGSESARWAVPVVVQEACMSMAPAARTAVAFCQMGVLVVLFIFWVFFGGGFLFVLGFQSTGT
jgi:hypothetical protein